MSQKSSHFFVQELLVLLDAYVLGVIYSSTFLDKATNFALGVFTASMLLSELSPYFASNVVSPDDKRIETKGLEF